ncbi:MAG: enoyl-CoA hydratase/isomerase family protein [Actinomycetota bacterium]
MSRDAVEAHVAVTAAGDTPVDHVAEVRLTQPPNNFFSVAMITELAEALERLDDDRSCRAVVLAADGKHFCAGADFSGPSTGSTADLYAAAARLFRTRKPVVAAVQGAAIGGGLGVALAADFRIAAPEARFSANFARLGFHQGFGLSVTLPALVGQQRAAELLYTGRRVSGEEAGAIGLADEVVPLGGLLDAARGFAGEVAASAPLAVESIRTTLRGDLADRVEEATRHELAEQERLRATPDFSEGTRAMAERRTPNFTGETS